MAGVDRRRDGALETVVLNPGQILLQDRGGAFCSVAGSPTQSSALVRRKNFELRAAIMPRIEPVDFTGDPEHGQPVGIVERHGIAQDRQMPGTQRAGVPLHPMKVRTHPGRASWG